MPRSTTRGRVAAATAAATLAISVGATTLPAHAGSMYFSKSSGTTAGASWLEVGTLPGPVQGNAHVGFLFVEDLGKGKARVFGGVEDYECPDGVLPDGGGGHVEEPPQEPGCEFVDFRFIEGGNITFKMDRKFTSASLTGTLNVFGHDGPAGTPAVNMTWTGIGSSYKSTNTYSYTDEFGTYRSRYSFSGRQADVEGNIGPMVFDDEPGEYSSAEMGSYRSMDRGRGI